MSASKPIHPTHAMLHARLQIEQETTNAMSLLADPSGPADRDHFYRLSPAITGELVQAHLSKARKALQDFETAAMSICTRNGKQRQQGARNGS